MLRKKNRPTKIVMVDTYAESRCNRLHALFLHYSTVRMTVLAFLLPLGGILISNGTKPCAGVFVIAMAYFMNLLFSWRATDRWLLHKNYDLWLEANSRKSLDPAPNYNKFRIPFYLYFLLVPVAFVIEWIVARFQNLQAEGPSSAPTYKAWRQVLKNTWLFEASLQVLIFISILIFLDLLEVPRFFRDATPQAQTIQTGTTAPDNNSLKKEVPAATLQPPPPVNCRNELNRLREEVWRMVLRPAIWVPAGLFAFFVVLIWSGWRRSNPPKKKS